MNLHRRAQQPPLGAHQPGEPWLSVPGTGTRSSHKSWVVLLFLLIQRIARPCLSFLLFDIPALLQWLLLLPALSKPAVWGAQRILV